MLTRDTDSWPHRTDSNGSIYQNVSPQTVGQTTNMQRSNFGSILQGSSPIQSTSRTEQSNIYGTSNTNSSSVLPLLASSPINPLQSIRNSGSTIENTIISNSGLIQSTSDPLAAPPGWHSEVIQNSILATNSRTSPINTEQHHDYVSQTITDSPPMIFASTEDVDHLLDEHPLTKLLPTRNMSSSSGYSSSTITGSSSQEQQHSSFTQQSNAQQRALIQSVENHQLPPLIVHKKLPNNLVTYQQNVSVRFLKPPTPPPPGPIIIREVRPPPPRPQSPIRVRQRPPPPPTPPPMVLRENPPPVPPRIPTQVVEKWLPAPPPLPRRLIVERLPLCPPKPSDVIIERWLPYKRNSQRRILYEREPAPLPPMREPNLLILHDTPCARVDRQFINDGVIRADPEHYRHQYAAELDRWRSNSGYAHLVDEASRHLPPPYIGDRPLSPYLSNTGERGRSISLPPPAPIPYQTPYRSISPAPVPYRSISPPPIPYRSISPPPVPYRTSYGYDSYPYDSPYPYCSSSSYGYDRRGYNSPYGYCSSSSYRHGLDYSRSYDYLSSSRPNIVSMTDVTNTWDRYCPPFYRSESAPYYSSSYPSNSIRVHSESEFNHVLADLTHGQRPRTYY